jgi:hypothetical protein
MSDTERAQTAGDAIAALLESGLTQIESHDNSALGHALHRAVTTDFADEIGSFGSRV